MARVGDRPRPPLFVRIPPPLTFAAAFVLGMALQHIVPLPLPQAGWLPTWPRAGAARPTAGRGGGGGGVGLFAPPPTTILPSRSASAIVERGPYRFSRNPMYLSLVLAYAGLAGMLEAPWSLLLLPLPVATLQRVTIPYEESRLAAVLGEGYDRYRARVRRWI